MLFHSFEYIFLFLPLVVGGYFFLAKLEKYKRAPFIWLLLASLFFYGYWNPALLALLSTSIVSNFLLARLISDKQRTRRRRKQYLALGIIGNIAVIGYYKYANFFIDSLNMTLGSQFNTLNIILPLAISFFTFQQIAFLLDNYKNRVQEPDFLSYSLFVSFFPQLIAGPIVHHSEMMPQFHKDKTPKLLPRNIAIGITLFSIGLFKKVVIADNLGYYVDGLFSVPLDSDTLTTSEAWLGSIGFYLQIYFDFSAYTDMAMGAAMMFGIHLPINFHSPLKAINSSDFWNRWHITLTRFFRDYIGVPLMTFFRRFWQTQNMLGQGLQLTITSLVTMTLVGFWHGAGWNYLIWGLINGSLLGIYTWWYMLLKNNKLDNPATKVFSWLVHFLTSCLAIVFFRADSVTHAINYLKNMLPEIDMFREILLAELFPHLIKKHTLFGGFSDTHTALTEVFFFIGSALIIVLLLPNSVQWFKHDTVVLSTPIDVNRSTWTDFLLKHFAWKSNVFWGVATGILASIALLFLDTNHRQVFIYFQF